MDNFKMALSGLQIVFVIVLLAAGQTTGEPATAAQPTSLETTTMAETATTAAQTDASETTAVVTTDAPANAALPEVEGLTVSNSSTTGITLTWTKPATDVHVYNVSYEREDGTTNSTSTGAETFEFSGLDPGYNYTFIVTYEVSNKTEVSQAAWITFVLAPAKPKNINVVPHTTSLTLTWEKPAGKVDQYTVRLNDSIKDNPTTEKLVVPELLAGTLYKIAINAVSNGKQSLEEVVHAATRPEQAILMFQVSTETSNVSSVLLQIYSKEFVPSGSQISVHCQPQPKGAPLHIQRFPMQPSYKKYTVTNLSPGTEYLFTGYTELHGVESEPSEEKSPTDRYYTRFAAPQNLTVDETARGTTKVGIKWDKCGGFNIFILYCDGEVEADALTTPSGECTKLTPGTAFTAYVITNGTVTLQNGKSKNMSSAPSETLRSITVPLPPETFTAYASNSTSIRLNWTRGEGNLANWVLTIEPAEGSMKLPLSIKNTQTTQDIDGLTPGRLFNFRMIAQSVDPVTNETFNSTHIFVDERTYPEVPENITVLNTTESSLEVAWDAPTGDVSQYNVTACPSGGSSACKTAVSVTDTSANLRDLTPAGQKWTVKVTAVSGGKESQSSLDLEAFTYPLPLLSLTIDAVLTTNATLTWEHDAGDKAEELLLRWEPTTSTSPMNFSSTSASHVVSGLSPGERYEFFIKAKSGEWKSTEISSNYTTMVPVSPSNLNVTNTTTHQLAVSWNITEGLYDSFTARINPGPTNGSTTIDTNATDAEFINLEPGIEYNISVVAKAGDRESSTAWKSFNTSEIAPGPPRNLTVVEPVNSRDFTVMWEDPLKKNGWIKYYVLSVASPSGDVFSLNTSKDETNDGKKKITGLTPVTDYTVWVTAVNGAGAGKTSKKITVPTGEEASGVVTNLTVSNDTAFSMMVSWSHPLVPHGNILHYVLEVKLATEDAQCQQVVLFNCSDCTPTDETNALWEKVQTPCYTANDSHVSVEYQEKASVLYNVTSLLPFTEYTFTVYPVSKPGLGNQTSATGKTDEYLPNGPPRMVEAVSETSTSFKVSWQPPETPNGFITKYTVEYTDDEEGTKQSEETTDNSTSLVIDGLRSYKLYNIAVCANTIKGQGPCSEAKTRQTDQDKPSPPQDVEVTDATNSTYFVIKWKPPATPNGVILEYEVIATMLADNTETNTTINNTEILITDLKPHNNYSIQVRARTVKGYGNWSDVIYKVTAEGRPSLVRNCTAEALSSTNIALTWLEPETPNGVIRNYTIRYYAIAYNEKSETVTSDVRTTNLTGLEKWTDYRIHIRAETILEGSEVECTPFPIKTQEDVPSEPQNLTTVDVKPYSMVLKWDRPLKPNGDITNYTIKYGMPNDFNSTVSVNGSVTSIKIESLLACRKYNFKVAAHTRVGPGNFSEVKKFVTIPNLPGKPYDLDLQPFSSSELKLTWMKPNETCPAVYTIRIWSKDSQGEDKMEETKYTSSDNGSLLDSRASSCDIKGLSIYTQYSVDIKVVINNIEALKNFSSRTAKVRTMEDLAGQVKTFDITVCDDCYTRVQAKWDPPENKNGEITFYLIKWKVEGSGKEYNKSFPVAESTPVTITENIWSETTYIFTIQAQNGAGLGEKTSKSGVLTESGPAMPFVTNSAEMTRKIAKDTDGVSVEKWRQFAINLEEQLFDMTNGEVTEIGVFVATTENGDGIPNHSKGSKSHHPFPGWRDTLDDNKTPKATYYMIEQMKEPPSSWKKVIPSIKRRAVSKTIVIIGKETGCPTSGGEQKYCNAPLQPETNYCVAVGGYTKWGFTRTPCAEFRTGAEPFPLTAFVAGIVCALLIIIIIIIVGIIVKRKRQKRPKDPETIELGPKVPPLEGEDNGAFVITDEYGDEVTVGKPSPISVRSFPAIVSQMHHENDKMFKWQYKLLEKVSPVHTTERAVKNEGTKSKNRYINILPFDHTLVHLNIPKDEESGPAAGYTNANYIPGNNHRKEYIASQGPMDRTIDDFWQMVWEQNVSTIIMLTKCVEDGKEKCAQYWPKDQNPVINGDLQVQLLSESFMDDYVIRMVELSDLLSEKTSKVMQFHFLSWPDWGKPDSSFFLLNFVDVVQNHRRTSDTGPKLVHCSAGIGRTGTYITVERLLEQIARQPKISVFDTILDLRESRKGMVQGPKQYTYIHECLKDAIEQRIARKQIHKSPPMSTQNGNTRC